MIRIKCSYYHSIVGAHLHLFLLRKVIQPLTLSLSPLSLPQMKDDFQRLEDDMDHLSSRMEQITEASNSINSALADRKQEISQLCGVHHLLKKVGYRGDWVTTM